MPADLAALSAISCKREIRYVKTDRGILPSRSKHQMHFLRESYAMSRYEQQSMQNKSLRNMCLLVMLLGALSGTMKDSD